MKKQYAFLILICFMSSPLIAQEIKTQLISYKDGETELEGYLAYDPQFKDKRPAVIVVHEWTGINDYTKKHCDQLAKMGYVAFAADVYGKGIRPSNFQDAAKEANKYKDDRTLMRRRMNTAFEWIKVYERTDVSRIAVVGYCFGATAALELARSGAGIKGTVCFHGELNNPTPENTKKIQSKVVVFHGAIDPVVPKEQVDAFLNEMNAAKVDYQFIVYSKAAHAFTNPSAGNDPSKGAAYNKEADLRSWEAMKLFLAEIFD